ncbi:MAG: hypothetical protein HFI50_00575 [Lachnospiraceae bacterium]|nr:hypothetical protein [Lachnospiraceae bacterium]
MLVISILCACAGTERERRRFTGCGKPSMQRRSFSREQAMTDITIENRRFSSRNGWKVTGTNGNKRE